MPLRNILDSILLKLRGYARNFVLFWDVFFWFIHLFIWFVLVLLESLIVNTGKKISLTDGLTKRPCFFSFSGSPLTGTLRETPPVSRTKTGLCSMFCVKETSQNGNILRSGGQISSYSIIQILLSIVQCYLFDHI